MGKETEGDAWVICPECKTNLKEENYSIHMKHVHNKKIDGTEGKSLERSYRKRQRKKTTMLMSKMAMGVIIILIIALAALAFNYFSSKDSDGQHNNKSYLVSINGNGDYVSIQKAIDKAPDYYTIYVSAGTYYENIIINKPIVLKGENKKTTIIDGNHKSDVISIEVNGQATISGFTIRNSGTTQLSDEAGIKIISNNNSIFNNIIYNNTIGIYARDADYNNITQNVFDINSDYGMYLYSSCDYFLIKENVFTNNECGLRIKGSIHNNVTKNMFLNNEKGMFFCCAARLNKAYHNTFMNNTVNAEDTSSGNDWDGGYPTGGNYWDDYIGKDKNQGILQNLGGTDDIGDTPYTITSDGTKKDNFPLMEPVVHR